MNKGDLINLITEKTTLTRTQICQVIDETFRTITEALSRGEKFQILGFGTFQVKTRAQRKGINPRTGEKIRIDSKTIPVFSPGKKLLDAINDRENNCNAKTAGR